MTPHIDIDRILVSHDFSLKTCKNKYPTLGRSWILKYPNPAGIIKIINIYQAKDNKVFKEKKM